MLEKLFHREEIKAIKQMGIMKDFLVIALIMPDLRLVGSRPKGDKKIILLSSKVKKEVDRIFEISRAVF